MGFGMAAGGLAVPMVAWSMQTFGWRATAFGSGVVLLVVGLPLALAIKSRPEDHGQIARRPATRTTPGRKA
jgi:OFA family oxalate/formate antiporter-like MFS transporter